MNTPPEDPLAKVARSCVDSLLAHHQYQGYFVLVDYQGRTYGCVLQTLLVPKECAGLVKVHRVLQPLPERLCIAILQHDKAIKRLTTNASLSLEGRAQFDAHLQDHALEPLTHEQYAYIMSKPS